MRLSAAEILDIQQPGTLFTGNPDTIKAEYGELAKTWHPDHNSNSQESGVVMSHINLLYQRGIDLMRFGSWENLVSFV